ncbi:hypothetical protein OAH12_00690 [Cyclobacteriaceae bacterium]|nr:hypothetical protein [Cyclobacteriaceae bacterium]
MSRVLIVAPQFYPSNVGGSHRPFRMASFLSNYHDVVVFTSSIKENYDPSLEEKLKDVNFKIVSIAPKNESVRTTLYSKYYINIVDDFYLRWKASFSKALELEKEFSTIIVTTPPFSVGELLIDLKKKCKSKIIWDLRDAWSQWNIYPYATRIHYWLTLNLERRYLKIADKVLLTSMQTMRDLESIHGVGLASKLVYVPNSFDSFEGYEDDQDNDGKVKIGYVGSFYYAPSSDEFNSKKWYQKPFHKWFQYVPVREEWLYRSPYYFFKILREVLDKQPDLNDRLQVELIGSKSYLWLVEMIEEFGLSHVVILRDRMGKKKVIDFQKKMDFLLLTSSKKIDNNDCSIAGKTFEYFSLRKPILAFVSNGEQKNVLNPYVDAHVFDPDMVTESSDNLLSVLSEKPLGGNSIDYISMFLTEKALKPLLEHIV